METKIDNRAIQAKSRENSCKKLLGIAMAPETVLKVTKKAPLGGLQVSS